MLKRVLTYTESYVKNMYASIGILSPHQLDFREIAHRLGIHLFYWNDTSQALFFKNKGYIMLNENKTPEEQYEAFCHELAHVLLHTGSQCKLPKLFIEYQEFKANQFMYHAAVPTFMLDELNIYTSLYPVQLIQERFGVTEAFAQKRLEKYCNQLHFLNWNSEYQSFVQHS